MMISVINDNEEKVEIVSHFLMAIKFGICQSRLASEN